MSNATIAVVSRLSFEIAKMEQIHYYIRHMVIGNGAKSLFLLFLYSKLYDSDVFVESFSHAVSRV